MKQFLGNYKKRYASAKQSGDVDEHASEMMSESVFRFLCRIAIKNGNSFMWSWLVLQWNLMCRSINIESLLIGKLLLLLFLVEKANCIYCSKYSILKINVFKLCYCFVIDHMGVEGDAFMFKFHKTKCGQGGEQVHGKHVYANPIHPHVCTFLAFGVHCMNTTTRNLGSKKYFEGKEQADRFNTQLLSMVKTHISELESLGLSDAHTRLSTHSIRKGSATSCASSVCGPSIVCICLRADWKLGQVLQVCKHFSFPLNTK